MEQNYYYKVIEQKGVKKKSLNISDKHLEKDPGNKQIRTSYNNTTNSAT